MSEQASPEESERKNSWTTRLAAGLGVLAVGAGIWWATTDTNSGDKIVYDPTEEVAPNINGTTTLISWNMHGEASNYLDEINLMIDTYKVDAFLAQEVTDNDIETMLGDKRFKGMSIARVTTDSTTKGGYNNIIITPQRIEEDDVTTVAMAGNRKKIEPVIETFKGILEIDNPEDKVKDISDATQEDRAAIGVPLLMATSEGVAKVRVITTHVGGDPKVHQEQFEKNMKFIVDNKSGDEDLLICGDFNSSFEQVALAFAAKGFIAFPSRPTTTGEHGTEPKQIDICLQEASEDSNLHLASVRVLEDAKTDHKPVLLSVESR
ncbi:MAG: hypothetical protein U0524_01970 [Candidatus Saccharimonadales bacterium]